MKIVKKLKLLRVVINGDTCYLCSASIFGMKPTWNPLEATNYYGNDIQLTLDINLLVLPDDQMFAKSGIRVQSAEVVEMDLYLDETSSRVARLPYEGNK